MNRHQFEAHRHTYTAHVDQSREIGLRAVAAAILYQGDAANVERTLSQEVSAPPASATQPSDREL
jgi:hypothetical protein